jgi:glutathione synthase/RimK-type ligase-like ATP-grasp enzyme
MVRRVLIIGAGTGPGNNLIRSLRAGDPSLGIIGCHDNRFALKQSAADRNYLTSRSLDPSLLDELGHIVEVESIALVMPTTDRDVKVLATFRERIPAHLFLPRLEVIELCQDKYALTEFLRARDLPAPKTYAVSSLGEIEALFARLSPHTRVWCRLRRGQGALGAVLVTSPEQARTWIRFWEERRGDPPSAFTLSEYLPGRDIAAQTLWQEGRLVLVKTYERLTYLGAGDPMGASSIAALAKTVIEPRIAETCARALRAIDPAASGVFVFDFKENVNGVPCITEINAGRFGMSTNIFDLPGKHNMAVTYVKLALAEAVDLWEEDDTVEDHYMVRDVDTVPSVHHADEFFEGIEDTRR